MADQVLLYKYVVKNTAEAGQSGHRHAKPLFQDNGSGMHTHQTCGRTARTYSMTRRVTG